MTGEREPWHLDKRVPLALLLAIVGQTFGMGWWAASLSQRVTSLEESRTDAKGLAVDIAVIKNNMESIKDSLRRLENQVDGRPRANPGVFKQPDEYRPRP